jgi:hypothetical protein
MQTSRRVVLPWYTREDFPSVLAMMVDRHLLPADYDAWRISAEQNEEVARACGIAVVRVRIEPEAFARWCAERQREPDGAARRQFAEESAEL